MSTRSGPIMGIDRCSGLSRSGLSRAILTVLILVGSCAGAVALAIANTRYFALLNGYLQLAEAVPRALLFSSFLLFVGGAVVVWRPAAFGFRMGSLRRDWRLVGATIVGGAAATALALLVYGGTPFRGASWLIEVVVVPFTEELVFRAVLLTALLVVLKRIHQPSTATLLAIAFDALAFGLAHAANITELSGAFVTAQVAFATLVGAGCAWLMVRTGSVYPAMLLHGAVNAVVIVS